MPPDLRSVKSDEKAKKHFIERNDSTEWHLTADIQKTRPGAAL